MKKLLFFLGALLGTVHLLHAGESKLYPIMGPSQVQCCSQNSYSIDVENINPSFAIQNIYGKWFIRRNNQFIYEEEQYPRKEDLLPGETETFIMEIPMELLILDGLMEIYFQFHSDFDLNTDPFAYSTLAVIGCGITLQVAQNYFKDGFELTAEEQDAYLFLFQQLLKPGTIISDGYGNDFSTALVAYTWMAMIYNPLSMLGQPITILLLNSNTMALEVIEDDWPPDIDGIPFRPLINDVSRITGANMPPADPAPLPLTNEEFPSMPADSVCAILLAGRDGVLATMQEAFKNGVDLMKHNLMDRKHGPRLPEANIVTKNMNDEQEEYTGDSLVRDLKLLKGKYNKLYFYYMGHGTKDGKMAIGDSEFGALDYGTFVKELIETGAKKFCIMVDACYSGALIDSLCKHPGINEIDVDVVTGESSTKLGKVISYAPVGGLEQWFGMFSVQFYWAMGDTLADADKDGKITFTEAYKYVKEHPRDNVVQNQDPQYKNLKNYTRYVIGQKIVEKAAEEHGKDIQTAQVLIDVRIIEANTTVSSFDGNYEHILNVPSYVAMIDWKPNAMYGKPVTFAYVDATTFNVVLDDGNIFWPVINEHPDFNIFNTDNLFSGGYVFTAPSKPNTISQQYLDPPVISEDIIALIISGHHPDALMQQAYSQSADKYMLNLTQEESGDKIHPDNILRLTGINAVALDNIISGLTGTVNEVYFYYAGNFSPDGRIGLGNDPEEWTSTQLLLDRLAEIGAERYKLVLDGSYSGSALNDLDQHVELKSKMVSLITSTNAFFPAYIEIFGTSPSAIEAVAGSGTYHLMKTYGNPVAESDGIPGISHEEAFKRMLIDNPILPNGESLFEETSPTMYVGAWYNNPADVPVHIEFPNLDVDLNLMYRGLSALDFYAYQEINIEEQQSSSSDVFSISPVRYWEFDGGWEIDPLLTADAVFHFNEEIDLLDGSEGVLGLVSRRSDDDEWQAYYPAEYNQTESTITAINVKEALQWAVARVREVSGINDPIAGFSFNSVYPNPAQEEIQLSFMLEEDTEISVRVLDLRDRTVYATQEETYVAGENLMTIDISGLVAGLYYLEINGKGGKIYKPVIVE